MSLSAVWTKIKVKEHLTYVNRSCWESRSSKVESLEGALHFTHQVELTSQGDYTTSENSCIISSEALEELSQV